MTITLRALSLVGKAEPVQVCFTLCLRDQQSMWVQDGGKSLHGFLHGIEWLMFHGHSYYLQKPPLGGRPNTKPRDHNALNAHNRWFILNYHVRGPTWIDMHWNNIWWGPDHIWLHATLEGLWPHYMMLEVCWDDSLWTLSFGLSQLLMVTALGLVCEVAQNTPFGVLLVPWAFWLPGAWIQVHFHFHLIGWPENRRQPASHNCTHFNTCEDAIMCQAH